MSDAKDLIDQILNRRPRGPRGVAPPGGNVPTVQPKAFIAGLAVLLVIWAAASSLYTVQPEERAVVKRFGRVTGIADPGLHFKLPFGVDTVQIVATERVLKQEFGFRTENSDDPRSQFAGGYPDESLMLTGDLNIIQVEWVVQYQINDAVQYLYSMREPTKTLRDLSESVMRRVVGNRIGSDVLTVGRIEIANTARDEIQEAMERYDNGIRVIAVQLQDVVPPQRVQPAFNEVNEARQELERMVNDATRQANEAIPTRRRHRQTYDLRSRRLRDGASEPRTRRGGTLLAPCSPSTARSRGDAREAVPRNAHECPSEDRLGCRRAGGPTSRRCRC